MSDPNAAVHANLERMLAAWNEKDPERIRGHLEAALSPEIVFVDPDNDIAGLDAFEAMVRALRSKHPNVVSARTSGVDRHHDICRYTWRVTIAEGAFLDGMDVTRFGADGRVLRVDGFFGSFPARED